MAGKDSVKDKAPGSGLDMLRDELVDYLGAQAEHLVEKAGDRMSGLTEQLLDTADNGGFLTGVGSRVLGGQSPLKAIVSEKAGNIKDNLVGKAKDVFGKGKGKGGAGTTKVTNIIEVLDVGVPIRKAYDHWTQYDKFSGFTKGVRNVNRHDEIGSDWKAKVGPSTRGWKATVKEQIPDDRIVWTSEGAKGTTNGCVSFHELAPNLTRIVLVVEYYPSGFFEKTGNLWRAQGRRLRLDFKHFQRYVTLTKDDVEGWRGEIRDGEVVRTHEEAMEEEEQEEQEEQEEPEEGEEEEGYEDEESPDEDEDEDDGEYEDEDEEFEDEEDEEDEEE
ncbi:SRPBCC family protein [Streptomyces sp. NPDC059597]|uniref:SRPBCC family protein n=1 Tax=Streptomyces sp. NPDC059597 TaxID=3346879 RepID=UPI0036CBEFB8